MSRVHALASRQSAGIRRAQSSVINQLVYKVAVAAGNPRQIGDGKLLEHVVIVEQNVCIGILVVPAMACVSRLTPHSSFTGGAEQAGPLLQWVCGVRRRSHRVSLHCRATWLGAVFDGRWWRCRQLPGLQVGNSIAASQLFRRNQFDATNARRLGDVNIRYLVYMNKNIELSLLAFFPSTGANKWLACCVHPCRGSYLR